MNTLATDVAAALSHRNFRLATAESCTGGLVAAHLTGIPGSSNWFECAFVTYSESAKIRLLGVNPISLARYTAVSEPVAREMAIGALRFSDAHISVAITGIAGPGGGDSLTPVGTVWFAWAVCAPEPVCIQASATRLPGDREAVRQSAVEFALNGLLRSMANTG